MKANETIQALEKFRKEAHQIKLAVTGVIMEKKDESKEDMEKATLVLVNSLGKVVDGIRKQTGFNTTTVKYTNDTSLSPPIVFGISQSKETACSMLITMSHSIMQNLRHIEGTSSGNIVNETNNKKIERNKSFGMNMAKAIAASEHIYEMISSQHKKVHEARVKKAKEKA